MDIFMVSVVGGGVFGLKPSVDIMDRIVFIDVRKNIQNIMNNINKIKIIIITFWIFLDFKILYFDNDLNMIYIYRDKMIPKLIL
jgi:hypothetical protein